MKILLVTPYYYPKIGGLENYARQLALSLQRREGVEIVVVTSNDSGNNNVVEEIDGIKVYRLRRWFKVSNTPVNPLWVFGIKRIIHREQPDIIHAHTPVPAMADAAALASGNIPFVITYHAATLEKAGSKALALLTRIYQVFELFTLHRALIIFAVSDYVKQQLPSRMQSKVIVVPNAVWADQIVAREQPTKEQFIFIGSLDETHSWKGLSETIRAIREYKNRFKTEPQLIVVGDGNSRHKYEQLTNELDLRQNVIFVGTQTGKSKDDLLSASLALIAYPTSGNDAFPTVFLEAWSRGVPVITAAIGPIPSLVDDEINGYLVAPNNPGALADTMHKVLNNNRQRGQVAQYSAKLVKTNYTWERQASSMAKHLGALL